MINARFAAETARLTAGADAGRRSPRGSAAIEARPGGDPRGARGARPATGAALARLTETLAVVLQRLDAQAEVLHAHIAREDMVAGRLAELAALAGSPARLPGDARAHPRRVPRPARAPGGGAAPARVPQFS